MSRQGLGWLVEVTVAASDGHGRLVRRFHVAVPNRAEAIATVRRRVPGAADASVVAVTALSRRAVYDQLRLKRGDIVQAPDLEQKAPDLEQKAPDLEQQAPDLEQQAPDQEQQVPDLEQKAHLDELLDDALRQTFPCSDPVAVGTGTGTDPPARAGDGKATR
jgi:hypothetical protein